MKNLYRVKSINQETGCEMTTYVLAMSMKQIEEEFAEILLVEPIKYEIIETPQL